MNNIITFSEIVLIVIVTDSLLWIIKKLRIGERLRDSIFGLSPENDDDHGDFTC